MAKQAPRIVRNSLLNIIGRFALMLAFLVFWFYSDRQQIPKDLAIAASALKRNDVAAARTHFDRFLVQRPDSPEQYAYIIKTCESSKRPDLMLLYARRSIQDCKYAPNDQRSVLYGLLAYAYDLTEKAPKLRALEAADRAFHLDTESAENLNRLGYMMVDNLTDTSSLIIAQGYISRALRKIKDQAGGVDPNALAECQDSYGWALYKRGLYKESVSALLEAIAVIPDTAAIGDNMKYFYYHLGAAYHKIGRIREAHQTLDIALQYDPKFDLAIAERASLPAVPIEVSPPSDPASEDFIPDLNISKTPTSRTASETKIVVPNPHASGTTIGPAPGTLAGNSGNNGIATPSPSGKPPIVPFKTPTSAAP